MGKMKIRLGGGNKGGLVDRNRIGEKELVVDVN